MVSIHHQEWEFNNKKFQADVFNQQDFSGLSPIKQVYALLIDSQGKVAVVLNKSNLWILPGGGTEPGESPLETLVREVKEETNCDIDPTAAIPFYYQQVQAQQEDGTWGTTRYELRYVVPVKTFHPFEKDPDNNDTIKVAWISPQEITTYLDWWKDTAVFIQKELPYYIERLSKDIT